MARQALATIIKKQPVDFDFTLRNESRYLLISANNLGQLPFVGAGVSTFTQWASAAKPTVTANAWSLAKQSLVICYPGRRFVITKIRVETTDACKFAFQRIYDQGPTLDGSTGSIQQPAAQEVIYGVGTAGGETILDYSRKPFIMTSNQRIDLYTLSTTTTGTNWQITFDGYDITDDENYNAPFTTLYIGDSIGCLCQEYRALPFSKREDGTITGIYGNILQNNLSEAGIQSRLVSISVGGTTSSQWDYLVNNGRFKNALNYDLIDDNLGMNDCISDAGLIIGVGETMGFFKKALKNRVRSYFRKNPNGSYIVNGITATDLPSRIALVATGIYAGQQRVVAYRAEQLAAVNELKASNPEYDLFYSPNYDAYNSGQTDRFLTSETVNNYTHPNVLLGQPAIAAVMWPVYQQTKFYINNHS